MPPDRFFQKLKPENRAPFYSVIGLLVLGMMTMLALAIDESVSPQRRETLIKVIGYGGTFLGILFFIVRQDKLEKKATVLAEKQQEHNDYVHRINHDTRGERQAVILAANMVSKSSESVAEKADILEEKAKRLEKIEEGVQILQEKFDKNLAEAIHTELKNSPIPTSPEEWKQFVNIVLSESDAIKAECKETAKIAIQEFYEQLIREGRIKQP